MESRLKLMRLSTFNIAPSTGSLTYKTIIEGHFPTFYHWTITFPHSNGD
jgi:hypothetical protein